MPVSIHRPQQSLKRRRVGALMLGGIAMFQLVLPEIFPGNYKNADPALVPADYAPVVVGVAVLLLGCIVAAYLAYPRRSVCENIIASWRALEKKGDGGVDKVEFETATASIFRGRIELAELTYMHDLIKRLDTNGENPTDEDLSAGLAKVMTLIGGKPVETVDDLCDALKKLADAANADENDAIEADVIKEMSQKSMSKKSLSQRSLSQKSLSKNDRSSSQRGISQKEMSASDNTTGAARKSVTEGDDDLAA